MVGMPMRGTARQAVQRRQPGPVAAFDGVTSSYEPTASTSKAAEPCDVIIRANIKHQYGSRTL